MRDREGSVNKDPLLLLDSLLMFSFAGPFCSCGFCILSADVTA